MELFLDVIELKMVKQRILQKYEGIVMKISNLQKAELRSHVVLNTRNDKTKRTDGFCRQKGNSRFHSINTYNL